jgi:predicted dehydrogenase
VQGPAKAAVEAGDYMSSKSASQRKIRYAVVGLGHLAQVAVIPAFLHAENCELAALVTGDPTKKKELGKKHGVDRIYSYEQYDECLRHVDAVYLVLPNHLHREYTVRAAHAGVHILCEKPMAVTAEDCEAMIEAADASHVKLMIAYRLHFEEGNLEAIHLGESGTLGNLRIFTSTFAQQVDRDNIRLREKIENGGGPVYDIGVYCINAARYLFQDEPIEVFATTANNGEPRFSNTEEMTTVVMRFPNERIASFTCSFGAAAIGYYTLIGTKGLLEADPAYEYSKAVKLSVTVDEKTVERVFPKRDQFAAELVYFSDCILDNREPEPSGAEGLADVRIVQAVYKSASSGQFVRVPEFHKKLHPNLGQQIYRPAHREPKPVHAAPPSGEAA